MFDVEFPKRFQAFGSGLEFVWSTDPSEYAVRESGSTIKLFKNFKVRATRHFVSLIQYALKTLLVMPLFFVLSYLCREFIESCLLKAFSKGVRLSLLFATQFSIFSGYS